MTKSYVDPTLPAYLQPKLRRYEVTLSNGMSVQVRGQTAADAANRGFQQAVEKLRVVSVVERGE